MAQNEHKPEPAPDTDILVPLTEAEQHPPWKVSEYIEPAIMVLLTVLVFGWLLRNIFQANKRTKKRRQRAEQEIAQMSRRAANSPRFVGVRKNQNESIFTIDNAVKVTLHTEPSTRHVLIEWEFFGNSREQLIEFWYTDDAQALTRAATARRQAVSDENYDFFSLLSTIDLLHKAGQASAAYERGGEIAAAKHLPQLFAAPSRATKSHVERVLPNGVWFIQVNVETDTVDDSFVYTANLDAGVRAAQSKEVLNSTERVAAKIKQTADTMRNITQLKRAQVQFDAEIDADMSIPASEKDSLHKQNKFQFEEAIRALTAPNR